MTYWSKSFGYAGDNSCSSQVRPHPRGVQAPVERVEGTCAWSLFVQLLIIFFSKVFAASGTCFFFSRLKARNLSKFISKLFKNLSVFLVRRRPRLRLFVSIRAIRVQIIL